MIASNDTTRQASGIAAHLGYIWAGKPVWSLLPPSSPSGVSGRIVG